MDVTTIAEFMELMSKRVGRTWDCAHLEYFGDGSGAFTNIDDRDLIRFGWDRRWTTVTDAMAGYMELYLIDMTPSEKHFIDRIKRLDREAA